MSNHFPSVSKFSLYFKGCLPSILSFFLIIIFSFVSHHCLPNFINLGAHLLKLHLRELGVEFFRFCLVRCVLVFQGLVDAFNLGLQTIDLQDDRISFKFSSICILYDYEFKWHVILPHIWGQQLKFELAYRVDFHLVVVDLRSVIDTIERLHHDCDKHIQHSDSL